MFFDIETRSLYAPGIEGFNAFSNDLYISATSDNTLYPKINSIIEDILSYNTPLFRITYTDLINHYRDIEKLCCSNKIDEEQSFLLPSSETFAGFFAEHYFKRQH